MTLTDSVATYHRCARERGRSAPASSTRRSRARTPRNTRTARNDSRRPRPSCSIAACACAAACPPVGAGSMPSSLRRCLSPSSSENSGSASGSRAPGRARPGCARRAGRCAGRRRCCAGSGRARGTGRTRRSPAGAARRARRSAPGLTMRAASVSSVSWSLAASRLTAAARSADHGREQPGLVAVVSVERALGHLGGGRELVDACSRRSRSAGRRRGRWSRISCSRARRSSAVGRPRLRVRGRWAARP